MEPKAVELLERLRRSKARPKLTLDHFKALVEEYERLGRDRFFDEVSRTISPQPNGKGRKPSAAKDTLADLLERLQRRTGFNRQTFLNYVTDQIAYDFRLDVRLPKADRTLPKLIAFYKSQIGAEKLEAAALKVAEKYSQVHG